jgi:phage shock protein E
MLRLKSASLAILLTLALLAPRSTRADEKSTDKPATQPAVKKISVEEFEKMRQEKQAVVLDVRTPREFDAGHVPGAVNIPIASPDFKQRLSKLDKSKTYLVHCYRGSRSAAATREMSKMDFTSIYDFSGGMDAYQKAKKPVEK